jgi:hypothetical protein
MIHRFLALGTGVVMCAAALVITSSAQAQTSPSGHVPARTTYPPRSSASAPFSIHPGDHMFQATMTIKQAYQDAERVAPVMAYRPRAWSTTVQEGAGAS